MTLPLPYLNVYGNAVGLALMPDDRGAVLVVLRSADQRVKRMAVRLLAHLTTTTVQTSHNFLCILLWSDTQGEVTSQSLRSRYDRHFVGITRYNALS